MDHLEEQDSSPKPPVKKARYPRSKRESEDWSAHTKVPKDKILTVNYKPIVSNVKYVVPEENPLFYSSVDCKAVGSVGILRRYNHGNSPASDSLYFGRVSSNGFTTFKLKTQFASLFVAGCEQILKRAIKNDSGNWTLPGHETPTSYSDLQLPHFFDHPDTVKVLNLSARPYVSDWESLCIRLFQEVPAQHHRNYGSTLWRGPTTYISFEAFIQLVQHVKTLASQPRENFLSQAGDDQVDN